MSNKTAMQELIEGLKIDEANSQYAMVRVSIRNCIIFASSLLEKEKQQIINSCYAGKLMQCREGDKTPQEYYDSNFGDKVEEAGI